MDYIEFNLNHAGEIESLFISNGIYMTPRFYEDSVRRGIKKLVSDGVLELGEESEGKIIFIDDCHNTMFDIVYRTCDDLDQDWDDDYWEDFDIDPQHTEEYFF